MVRISSTPKRNLLVSASFQKAIIDLYYASKELSASPTTEDVGISPCREWGLRSNHEGETQKQCANRDLEAERAIVREGVSFTMTPKTDYYGDNPFCFLASPHASATFPILDTLLATCVSQLSAAYLFEILRAPKIPFHLYLISA